jgi:hypothetical protein
MTELHRFAVAGAAGLLSCSSSTPFRGCNCNATATKLPRKDTKIMADPHDTVTETRAAPACPRRETPWRAPSPDPAPYERLARRAAPAIAHPRPTP